MKTILNSAVLRPVMDKLGAANAETARRWAGESTGRQPVHTVYGGAHLFKAETCAKLGEAACHAFKTYAPDVGTFATALGLVASDPAQDAWLKETVYERVREKLAREAVEDFRIDFEDGFGVRSDAEEDTTAMRAAGEVAKGMRDGRLAPFIGLRIKTLSEELKHRSVRTFDLFLATLLAETGGMLPSGFVVTLPKITSIAQVEAFADVLELLERGHGLAEGTLRMEIMVEVTQSILTDDGRAALPLLLQAGRGRISGAHFGTYDYTAACNITAAQQAMDHPACDFARSMMKVAFAGRPICLSDGATNVMPVGPHREAKGGPALTPAALAENRAVVHRAWRLSYAHISHSLRNAFYQGWDLHPAQLPVRYGACYAFFLDGLKPATERLHAFIDKAAQATLLGDVFDDAATGQGLLNYFLRALACGAITPDEITATGLTLDEIQSRSFLKILEGRKPRGH